MRIFLAGLQPYKDCFRISVCFADEKNNYITITCEGTDEIKDGEHHGELSFNPAEAVRLQKQYPNLLDASGALTLKDLFKNGTGECISYRDGSYVWSGLLPNMVNEIA